MRCWTRQLTPPPPPPPPLPVHHHYAPYAPSPSPIAIPLRSSLTSFLALALALALASNSLTCSEFRQSRLVDTIQNLAIPSSTSLLNILPHSPHHQPPLNILLHIPSHTPPLISFSHHIAAPAPRHEPLPLHCIFFSSLLSFGGFRSVRRYLYRLEPTLPPFLVSLHRSPGPFSLVNEHFSSTAKFSHTQYHHFFLSPSTPHQLITNTEIGNHRIHPFPVSIHDNSRLFPYRYITLTIIRISLLSIGTLGTFCGKPSNTSHEQRIEESCQ